MLYSDNQEFTAMTRKTFSLLNGKLEFSEARVRYFETRNRFEILAEECYSDVMANFYTEFKNLDDLCQRSPVWFGKYLQKTGDLAIKILAENEHYDIDTELFIQKYLDVQAFNKPYQRVANFIEEIAASEEEKEAIRAARTESAGSAWAGGGFGVSGAIKGAATAGALNLAGAAMSGTFNMIGRGISAIGNSMKKDSFFKNKETIESFANAVYSVVANAHNSLTNYTNKHCKSFEVDCIMHSDAQTAQSLCDNMVKGNVPDDKIQEICLKALTLDPYNQNLYEFIFKKYADPQKELSKTAKFFRIKVLPKLQTTALSNYFDSLKINSEEDAINARKSMQRKADELGILDFTVYKPLERKIYDFDLQYRTVCGRIFDSREEAEKQRCVYQLYKQLDFKTKKSIAMESQAAVLKKAEQLKISVEWLLPYMDAAFRLIQQNAQEALDEFYKQIEITSESQAQQLRKVMAQKAVELELDDFCKYTPLEKLIERYDIAYRTLGGHTFQSRDEADKQKELWTVYEKYDFTADETTAESAKQAIETKAAELQINANWLLDGVNQAIMHFDDLACTSFGFRFKNRQDALSAHADEGLFFIALWNFVWHFIKDKKIFIQWENIPLEKRSVIKEFMQYDSEPVIYVHTTMLSSGKNGFAITPKGLAWNNGNDLLAGVAKNVVFQTLFRKKSQEMLDKNQSSTYQLSWAEFFAADTSVHADEKNKIPLAPEKILEASRTTSSEICDLLNALRNLKKQGISFSFTEGAKELPCSEILEADSKPTELPVRLQNKPIVVKVKESDFPARQPKAEAPSDPIPDNLLLLQILADYRNSGNKKIFIFPSIPQDKTNNFYEKLPDKIGKIIKKEKLLLLLDTTILGSCKNGVALTDEAIYFLTDSRCWRLLYADIFSVEKDAEGVSIISTSFDTFEISESATDVVCEILNKYLEK